MLKCTLTQFGNEDYISLHFNKPFTNKTIQLYSYDKLPSKRLTALKKKLEFLSLGCDVKIGTAEISLKKRGGNWSYFLPQVVEYLKKWWKEDFTVEYNDDRPPYEHYGEMGEKIREIELRPIHYGLKFDNEENKNLTEWPVFMEYNG